MSRGARRGLLGLALLAAVAAAAWWARPASGPVAVDSASDEGATPQGAPPLAGGGPRARRPDDASGPPSRPGRVAPVPGAGPGPTRSVRWADGAAPAGAEAWVTVGARRFPVEVGADGTFTFPPEAGASGAGRALWIAGPEGFRFSWSLEDPPDGPFTVPATVRVTGRVLDLDGHAVVGLPLVLTDARVRSYAVFARDLDPAQRISGDPGQHVTVTTDAEGRFTARVVADRPCRVLADAGDRFLLYDGEAPGDVRSRLRAWTLTALPGMTLEGTATDAGTGAALSDFHLAVEQREGAPGGGLRFGDESRTSPFRATWARLDPSVAATFDVVVSAGGYVPEHAVVRWGANEATATLDARLRTIASMGGKVPVTLDVVDADGKPSDLGWFAEVRTGTETPTVMSWAKMAPVAGTPGRYVADVPPGRWDLRVVLAQHFYWMTSWHGPVLAETGRDATVRCEVPTSSPLTLRWTGGTRSMTLGFRRAGDASWTTESTNASETDGTTFPAWPVGTWEFSVGARDEAEGARRTGRVEVVPGTPATLLLSR